MALITTQIPFRNYESIRDSIAAILAVELAGQSETIDVSVWLERNIPFDNSELPAINVLYDNSNFEDHNPKNKRSQNQFFIDVLVNADSENNTDGDKLASLKAQRIAGICDYILSHPLYYYLGFSVGIIQSRKITDIKVGKIQNDSYNTTVCRLTFSVQSDESVENITPIQSEVFTVQCRLDETEKGFRIEIIN